MLDKLNSDQAFSLLNNAIAMVGTVLATNGALSADVQQIIIGVVTTVGSFALAWWLNDGNILDQAHSAFRKLLFVFGTFATTRGWVTAEQVQAWSGPVLAIATVVWGQWFYRDAPGPNLIGTTVT